MEIAALVVRGAGIPAVIATSFARSFYRNGVNNGLLLLEADTSSIEEGDEIAISMEGEILVARNLTKGHDIGGGMRMSRVMADILEAGGLVGYINKRGPFRAGNLPD